MLYELTSSPKYVGRISTKEERPHENKWNLGQHGRDVNILILSIILELKNNSNYNKKRKMKHQ